MDILPHAKTTKLIAECADVFHVNASTEDVRRWSAGFTMAKSLDTLADDDHEYNTGEYTEKLLKGETIPYMNDDEAEFVRETYDTLSDDTQEKWKHAASQLGEYAVKRLQADTVSDYVQVALEESQLMADVLHAENDAFRLDKLARDEFNVWMNQLGRTAYACDTLSDFVRDYNEGNTIIRPTLKTTLELASQTAKELPPFIKMTPPGVYGAFAKRAVTKVAEKATTQGFWRTQFVRGQRDDVVVR